MNLSPPSKNLFIITLILHRLKNYPIIGILFINGIFILKLVNTPLASGFLINLYFLLPQTAQFEGFVLSVFFL